jgi:adenylosuccinate lyase
MVAEQVTAKMLGLSFARQETLAKLRFLNRQAIDISRREGKRPDFMRAVQSSKFVELMWDELNELAQVNKYTERNQQIVSAYYGSGRPVEKALEPYADYVVHGITSESKVEI